MIEEIEKTFFDTFGIEPKKYCKRCCWCKIEETTFGDYDICLKPESGKCNCAYPQITDRILLELILINMHNEDLFGYPTNIQELKDNTLKQLIETYNKFSTCVTCDGGYQESARDIEHQVHILFEDG